MPLKQKGAYGGDLAPFVLLSISHYPELLEQVREETRKLNAYPSTYVRWCIRTGLYFKALDSFVRSKSREDE